MNLPDNCVTKIHKIKKILVPPNFILWLKVVSMLSSLRVQFYLFNSITRKFAMLKLIEALRAILKLYQIYSYVYYVQTERSAFLQLSYLKYIENKKEQSFRQFGLIVPFKYQSSVYNKERNIKNFLL